MATAEATSAVGEATGLGFQAARVARLEVCMLGCGGVALIGGWSRSHAARGLAALCGLSGLGVLGRQLLALSDAMLGPGSIRREPAGGLILHNQLATAALFAVLLAAVYLRLRRRARGSQVASCRAAARVSTPSTPQAEVD